MTKDELIILNELLNKFIFKEELITIHKKDYEITNTIGELYKSIGNEISKQF